jgi:hypothetical protein
MTRFIIPTKQGFKFGGKEARVMRVTETDVLVDVLVTRAVMFASNQYKRATLDRAALAQAGYDFKPAA